MILRGAVCFFVVISSHFLPFCCYMYKKVVKIFLDCSIRAGWFVSMDKERKPDPAGAADPARPDPM